MTRLSATEVQRRMARRRDLRARGESVPYLRKMAWLMPRMPRAVPYLGDVVVSAAKPRIRATQEG